MLESISLDVGCGFVSDELFHKKRGSIGIDLHRGKADILASAESLPFKDDIFEIIYVRNLLEHLKHPTRCLKDVNRVAKKNSDITITIPVHANVFYQELESMLLEFPFGLFLTVRRLMRIKKHRHILGWAHLNKINPLHVGKILKIKHIQKDKPKHAWALGRKAKLLEKTGIQVKIIGPRRSWFISATKKI